MVNIGMVWLRSKPSLTITESAGSSILVENQWYYKRGGQAGCRVFFNHQAAFID